MHIFKFPLNMDFPGQLTKQFSRQREDLVLGGPKNKMGHQHLYPVTPKTNDKLEGEIH